MGKDHIKRLAAPKTWHVKRKKIKYITKPMPGPHSLETGTSLNILLKEILNYAVTTREGKKRKNFRFPVGIFDTIEFTNTNEFFRIVLNKKGKLGIIKIKKEEALLKPCKIIGKTMVRSEER